MARDLECERSEGEVVVEGAAGEPHHLEHIYQQVKW